LGYFRINFNIALLCHRLMELILRANKLIQKRESNIVIIQEIMKCLA
jgi:hypothetical protein